MRFIVWTSSSTTGSVAREHLKSKFKAKIENFMKYYITKPNKTEQFLKKWGH